MRVSDPCPKNGPETGRRQPAGTKKGGRSTWGSGGLLAVAVIVAAVSGCGGAGTGDKAAASTPASPSAKASSKAAPAATHKAAPAATHEAALAPTHKAAPATVLTLTGSGTKNTQVFTSHDPWTLSYTFDCSKAMGAVGGTGNFIVFDKTDQLVNKLEKSGKGSATRHTSGRRRLQIVSECAWTVKITS